MTSNIIDLRMKNVDFGRTLSFDPFSYHSVITANRAKLYLPEPFEFSSQTYLILDSWKKNGWKLVSRFAPKKHRIDGLSIGIASLFILEKD